MEFSEYRRDAIRYWERRRIIWNALLLPPSVLAYLFPMIPSFLPDATKFGVPVVVALFCFAAIAANICYSFVYVIEFWIAGRNVDNGYLNSGRTLLFLLGCLIGIGLALIGGQSIALMQHGSQF